MHTPSLSPHHAPLSNKNPKTDVVLFNSIKTNCQHNIAIITLNDPKSLNALSLEMCQLITKQLSIWQTDNTIVAIVFNATGNKAFCAGGNIRKLYESMLAQSHQNQPTKTPNPYATQFFSCEYALYRQMYFYPKPIILWGNGFVMGGGLGLMAMCSHRIVTENTKIAMPEIKIGLYPDASGSWFLQRMPAKLGLFLGLTGVQCNGADALLCNLAEYAMASQDFDVLLAHLVQTNWQVDKSSNHTQQLHHIASQTLSKLHQINILPNDHIHQHWQQIQKLMQQGDIFAIDTALRNPSLQQQYQTDIWFSQAIENYQKGCPVSASLTFEIFQHARHLSLEQILIMELNISLNCTLNPDFREGVRALLIDKDNNPKWHYTLAECSQDYILSHFDNPFTDGVHPFLTWSSTSNIDK